MIKCVLTIVFDEPFYKAIFERIDGNSYSVAQVNLGTSLPRMPEIIYLVNRKYSKLNFYRNTIENRADRHINPKRAQRLAHTATQQKQIGTKAQIALKKQFEESKIIKKMSVKSRLKNVKNIEVINAKKLAPKCELFIMLSYILNYYHINPISETMISLTSTNKTFTKIPLNVLSL